MIKKLILKYKDILLYLIFGGLTTLVSYGVYLPLYNAAGFSATLSNLISWVAAVAFAFLIWSVMKICQLWACVIRKIVLHGMTAVNVQLLPPTKSIVIE